MFGLINKKTAATLSQIILSNQEWCHWIYNFKMHIQDIKFDNLILFEFPPFPELEMSPLFPNNGNTTLYLGTHRISISKLFLQHEVVPKFSFWPSVAIYYLFIVYFTCTM